MLIVWPGVLTFCVCSVCVFSICPGSFRYKYWHFFFVCLVSMKHVFSVCVCCVCSAAYDCQLVGINSEHVKCTDMSWYLTERFTKMKELNEVHSGKPSPFMQHLMQLSNSTLVRYIGSFLFHSFPHLTPINCVGKQKVQRLINSHFSFLNKLHYA